MTEHGVLFEGDTDQGHYIIVDTYYGGRPARVLYSGQHQAAQSGVPHDDKDEMLFDYNQRFLELTRGLKPKTVLIIGGGVFTLSTALTKEFPKLKIDVAEPDAELQKLATKYFDFKQGKRLQVHMADGRSFLNASKQKYDLIVVDAFMHTTIPPSLQTVEAAKSLREHLSPKGVVAMNIIAGYHGSRSAVLKRQIAAFQTAFSTLELFPAGHGLSLWLPQNFVLVGYTQPLDVARYFRYAQLKLLPINANDAMHD